MNINDLSSATAAKSSKTTTITTDDGNLNITIENEENDTDINLLDVKSISYSLDITFKEDSCVNNSLNKSMNESIFGEIIGNRKVLVNGQPVINSSLNTSAKEDNCLTKENFLRDSQDIFCSGDIKDIKDLVLDKLSDILLGQKSMKENNCINLKESKSPLKTDKNYGEGSQIKIENLEKELKTSIFDNCALDKSQEICLTSTVEGSIKKLDEEEQFKTLISRNFCSPKQNKNKRKHSTCSTGSESIELAQREKSEIVKINHNKKRRKIKNSSISSLESIMPHQFKNEKLIKYSSQSSLADSDSENSSMRSFKREKKKKSKDYLLSSLERIPQVLTFKNIDNSKESINISNPSLQINSDSRCTSEKITECENKKKKDKKSLTPVLNEITEDAILENYEQFKNKPKIVNPIASNDSDLENNFMHQDPNKKHKKIKHSQTFNSCLVTQDKILENNGKKKKRAKNSSVFRLELVLNKKSKVTDSQYDKQKKKIKYRQESITDYFKFTNSPKSENLQDLASVTSFGDSIPDFLVVDEVKDNLLERDIKIFNHLQDTQSQSKVPSNKTFHDLSESNIIQSESNHIINDNMNTLQDLSSDRFNFKFNLSTKNKKKTKRLKDANTMDFSSLYESSKPNDVNIISANSINKNNGKNLYKEYLDNKIVSDAKSSGSFKIRNNKKQNEIKSESIENNIIKEKKKTFNNMISTHKNKIEKNKKSKNNEETKPLKLLCKVNDKININSSKTKSCKQTDSTINKKNSMSNKIEENKIVKKNIEKKKKNCKSSQDGTNSFSEAGVSNNYKELQNEEVEDNSTKSNVYLSKMLQDHVQKILSKYDKKKENQTKSEIKSEKKNATKIKKLTKDGETDHLKNDRKRKEKKNKCDTITKKVVTKNSPISFESTTTDLFNDKSNKTENLKKKEKKPKKVTKNVDSKNLSNNQKKEEETKNNQSLKKVNSEFPNETFKSAGFGSSILQSKENDKKEYSSKIKSPSIKIENAYSVTNSDSEQKTPLKKHPRKNTSEIEENLRKKIKEEVTEDEININDSLFSNRTAFLDELNKALTDTKTFSQVLSQDGRSLPWDSPRSENELNNFSDFETDENLYEVKSGFENLESIFEEVEKGTDCAKIIEQFSPNPEALKLFKTMMVAMPYDVPRLHQIPKSFTSAPSRWELEEIKSESISFKTTKFVLQEDEIILDNWKKFCEFHDLDLVNAKKLLIFAWKSWKTDQLKNFVQFLAHNLDDRMLHSVYNRFLLLTQNATKGRFSHMEDKIICYFVENAKKDAFAQLSLLLNRPRNYIRKHYEVLKANKIFFKSKQSRVRIKWNSQLYMNFIQTILRVKKREHIKDLENLKIEPKDWKEISEQLKIPQVRLKNIWYNSLYDRLFGLSNYKSNVKEVRERIVNLLYEAGYKEWREIDWNKIASKIPSVTKRKIYLLFKLLVKRNVPPSRQHDLRKVVKYLKRHGVAQFGACNDRYKFCEEILNE